MDYESYLTLLESAPSATEHSQPSELFVKYIHTFIRAHIYFHSRQQSKRVNRVNITSFLYERSTSLKSRTNKSINSIQHPHYIYLHHQYNNHIHHNKIGRKRKKQTSRRERSN